MSKRKPIEEYLVYGELHCMTKDVRKLEADYAELKEKLKAHNKDYAKWIPDVDAFIEWLTNNSNAALYQALWRHFG